jgi:hypothetical protein
MKRNILLILLLLSSLYCFAQRNDPALKSSRVIKYFYGNYGNDTTGYFRGQAFLDSSSILLKTHIYDVSVISVNEENFKVAEYHVDEDSGSFTVSSTSGYYDYTITRPGYQRLVIKGFHPSNNQQLYIKAILEPGSNESIYTITNDGTLQKYVPSKPSWIGAFYYGDYSDTTVALLWGELFLKTISPSGDSSVTFGKTSIKYRCIETGDTGHAETNDAGNFSIYFKDGHYDLTISNPGYQAIVIKNYNAYEAQGSYLDAVLEPGSDESVFTITNAGTIEKER